MVFQSSAQGWNDSHHPECGVGQLDPSLAPQWGGRRLHSAPCREVGEGHDLVGGKGDMASPGRGEGPLPSPAVGRKHDPVPTWPPGWRTGA